MDYMESLKLMELSYKFYDTIDFKQFINEKEMLVRELMNKLEEYYDINHPELLPEELEGCFFNVICEDEFAEYLAKRYGFKTRYEVIEKYYITQ